MPNLLKSPCGSVDLDLRLPSQEKKLEGPILKM
jgi:hypothetical protein